MEKQELSNNVNRRQFIRVDASLIVKVEELSGDDFNSGISKNISKGGILFEYNRFFPLGTVLSLEIKLKDLNYDIECYGKIVRIAEITFKETYDIAVNFVNMDQKDYEILSEYIKVKCEVQV